MDKKIALVSGATRGIGKAIALRLADDYFVIGTATTVAGVESIQEYLGDKGVGYALDVANRTQIQTLSKDILAQFGAVSILVNNAGITKDGLCMAMKDAQWDDLVAVNMTGTFLLTRSLLSAMVKKRFGRIINITSVVASMGNPGQTNYVATKAAIEGMSRALAKEVAKRNVTVNCVAPGFIISDMTAQLSEQQITAITQHIPAGSMGEGEDVAHVVRFLADEASGYITGATIPVNGGLHM